MKSSRVFLLSLALITAPGCLYKAGGNVGDGFLDAAAGNRKSGGIKEIADQLVEDAVAQKLGEQLSSGLMAGVGEITPDQRRSLEETIDAAILVATQRAGSGLRDEVSPQLREMVKQDIVNALVEGFRGDLGDSMEESVQRMSSAAMFGIRRHIDDPALRDSLAELIRDSVYIAMREGGTRPAVGETIERTLSENMLTPMEHSVSGIKGEISTEVSLLTAEVAQQVDDQNTKLEDMMTGIISALVVILGVFILLYSLTRRQLLRARDKSHEEQQRFRAIGAAIQLLDDQTRDEVMGRAEGFAGSNIDLPTKPTGVRVEAPRSDSYARAEASYVREEDTDE